MEIGALPAILLVDVQEKLFVHMYGKERLEKKLVTLLKGARILGAPVVWAEQCPEKLGPTIASVTEVMEGARPLPKTSFSCWKNPAIRGAIEQSGRRNVVIAGIETHICVYQTAIDMAADGYRVEIAADAVSSRDPFDRDTALHRMSQEEIAIASVEMLLFRWLGGADHERFRDVSALLK